MASKKLFEKFSTKILKTILLLPGFILFFILRILQPVFHFRIAIGGFERIGHYIHAELYLRKKKAGEYNPGEFLIIVSEKTANQQLHRMFQRRLCLIDNDLICWMSTHIKSITKKSPLWLELPYVQCYQEVLDTIPPQLAFIGDEESKGKKLLEEMGIKNNEPFICLHVRDKAYLNTVHNYRSPQEWAYHDYRNCNVENFLPAAEHLASHGLYVLRMGHVVEKPFVGKSDKVIDYANKFRSELGDIYCISKCKFFIATEGGLHSIAWMFNIPVAYSNSAPPAGLVGWREDDVVIHKKLWDKNRKRFLTYKEIVQYGADAWYQNDLYLKAGLEVVENSPEEIVELAKEMNARLDKTWVITAEEIELQNRYRSIFPAGHRSLSFRSRIGTDFLRKNRELLQ
ncbi:MAG: hypothetical protein A2787_02080 [Omnitrophica WOR_2 bacterium RIFCSPHIGHO2_01_FULL_48_9]|nr:MAG: hypothetical protein A3D10_01800 [Omnitrophica WOR_2 bacterium RIFCSPHIGHO2_02_FULL_48_11]OGX34405.1 MAG: hypothetical protein A2787_02080 [Omnitrophica WOR_2 bacterium RIFCSPHIGHO2_01_FULL_48_9]